MSTAPPASGSRKRRFGVGMIVYALVAVLVVGWAVVASAQSAHKGEDLRSSLTLIAPAGAGGGWDTFAREQQAAMRSGRVVNNVQVVNIPGAGGTIGLSKFATMTGEASTLLVTGTVMIGAIEVNDSPNTLADARPLARISEEYDVIVVPADSPFRTIDDLVAEWKKNPKAMTFTGGSAGGLDHLIVADLAIKAGMPASQITYLPKSGGGEAIQILSSGSADAAVSGINEFSDQIAAGRMRALAIVAPERVKGIDTPTLKEQGYDVEMTNWRGYLAAPGTTDEQFAQLQQLLAETANTQEWKDAMARNEWTDVFLTGPELDTFIAEDTRKIQGLVKELGL